MSWLNKILIFSVLMVVSSSCAVVVGPPQYNINRKSVEYDPFGSWVNLEYKLDGVMKRYGGELIATSEDSIYILDSIFNICSNFF